jgi:hypothetical protein
MPTLQIARAVHTQSPFTALFQIILRGKGSGALKKAGRDYLKSKGLTQPRLGSIISSPQSFCLLRYGDISTCSSFPLIYMAD